MKSMNRSDVDLVQKLETERLHYVENVIHEEMADVVQEVKSKRLETEDIKRNFWDNVTVNLTDDTERIETFTSIQQEARVLAEQERSKEEAEQRLDILKRLADSPYFGRVDFKADGDQEAENIYIGLASLLEKDGETFLIYDWRAPISSLFYDHSPGKADYETPGGIISGEMTLKRQFTIRQGQIKHMFDTDVTIGDAFLQEALSQSANTQMKSIVATIQREQNRVIRDEKHRLLIVQGAAGSGKTSAALQRVAYLLYRYRGSLTADQIVLFSPNPLFNSYISHVLPELGEANMRQSTFQEYVQRRLGAIGLEVEDLYDQTEYVLAGQESELHEARLQAIKYKSSPDFFAILHRYVQQLDQDGMKFKDIRYRGRVLISGKQLSDIFYREEWKKYKLHERLKMWKKYVAELLREQEKVERKRKWVSEAIELLDDEAYRKAYEKLRESNQFKGDTFDDERKERALLRKMVVQEAFAPLYRRLRRGRYIDYLATYRNLFHNRERVRSLIPDGNLPEGWERFEELLLKAMEERKIWYEDATPLFYLKESIEGFTDFDNSVRHVIIDEAQDYSPLQFAVIRKLFPRARLTVLGDLNQAIYLQTAELNGFAELADLFDGVGQESIATIRLLRSYRSTKQIVELSKRLLETAADIEPFNREGREPEFVPVVHTNERVEHAVKWVSDRQGENRKHIGILTYTAKEASEVYERIRERMQDVHLITKETIELQPGVSILPAYLAKGIEFDAVLIWNASRYGESDRKLLYTAFTRAMHDLAILYTDDKPGLLESLIP